MNPNSQKIRQSILDLLQRKGSRVLAIRDIADRLAAEAEPFDRDEVASVVEQLEREGAIVAVRGKRYSLLEFTPYLSGSLRIYGDGYGIVRTADRALPDVYVDRRSLKGAMNGDVVLVRVDKAAGPRKNVRGKDHFSGEISRVLQRAHRAVVGRFHDFDPPFIRPFDTRLDSDILVDPESTMDARDGEMVNVEIDQYADRNQEARGRVIEVLGFIGDPGVDIEVVIRKFGIAHQFPDEVLEAAEAVPDTVSPEELAAREDLRGRNIVTIDGETAKDFDDAVEVTRLENGNYLLGVHIADVSHYVEEGGIIDREAYERGTSVYFPGRAVPMLPERLSNGICSLNPRVERLTFSVSVEIDPRGRFVDRRVYRSVIKTKERMTYTDVNALLTEPTPELQERYAPLLDDFRRMHELFTILRTRREARGSIDFDLPEAFVLLGEGGHIETIEPTERNVAHRLIEEFMLVANEVVAQQLVFVNQPGLFRVHQAPDAQKIADLKNILKEFKYTLRVDPEDIRPGVLQKVLTDVAGTPEERFLTEFILRSMTRAFYYEESTGHFALALQHYCHFTSPIRRYPDLVVHRMLGSLLEKGPMIGEERAAVDARLPGVALQSSERERRAEEAEREVLEWKKVIFMRDKVGMFFSGRVTGVVPFGLFVELDEYFVQGLVPVSTIAGDFWVYQEREHRLRGAEAGREFRLGDSVTVEVHSIDEDRRQIEFRLLASGGAPVEQREADSARRNR